MVPIVTINNRQNRFFIFRTDSMQECNLNIINPRGLHVRSAALFVQAASKYQSSIRVCKDGQEVDGKSIMSIVTLAAECGSSIRILIEGPDELEMAKEMSELSQSKKFNEE